MSRNRAIASNDFALGVVVIDDQQGETRPVPLLRGRAGSLPLHHR